MVGWQNVTAGNKQTSLTWKKGGKSIGGLNSIHQPANCNVLHSFCNDNRASNLKKLTPLLFKTRQIFDILMSICGS